MDSCPALNSRAWRAEDRDACLGLFDANCPEFFAPNERAEYAAWLDAEPQGYHVCMLDGRVAGAWGLRQREDGDCVLNWILLAPAVQGRGIGRRIMQEVRDELRARGAARLHIGASHKSAPFFARFGAVEIRRTPDGWGPGMHRVDMELQT